MKRRTVVGGGVAISIALAGIACDDGAGERRGAAVAAVRLHGVGASVPRALFAKWAEQYALVDPGVVLTYDADGSGAGVRAAEQGQADFGVSDSPLSDQDLAAHPEVRHVPLAVEAVAIVYTLQALPSSARLQVTEDLLADMLLGRIRFWDDDAIAAVNPGAKLPHTAVTVVYRGDESGASFLLSSWLAQTSKRWSLPSTRSLTLPVGTPVQKDDGVVARLHATDGALAYVSAATALSEHLSDFALRNPAGHFVGPTLEGMRAAAGTARITSDLRADATATSGELAYPLCGFTFGLLPADGPNRTQRRAVARFLWWATHDGQKFAPQLGLGGLPGELAVRDEDVLRSLRAAGEPAVQ